MMSGMSCSITSIAAPSSRWMRTISGPNASASRCATPPVGSSSSSTRASTASSVPSSTMRRVPGRQVRHELVARSARGRGSRSSSAASARLRRSAPGDGGSPVIDGTSHERSRASSATMIVSRTVSAGIQPGGLEAAAEAGAVAAVRGQAADVAAEHLDARRVAGTKPPIAFISVDLPAPLVPMSPTSSPARTSSVDVVDGAGCRRSARSRRAPTSHGVASGSRDRRRRRASGRASRSRAPAPRRRGRRAGGRPTPSTASRRRYTICMSPPGKYISRISRPMLLVNSRTCGGVVEHHREAAHPQRADDRARDRTEPADHRGRDDAQRLLGRERLRRRDLLAQRDRAGSRRARRCRPRPRTT